MKPNPYQSNELRAPEDSDPKKDVLWAHWVAGLFVFLTLMPPGYVAYFLWMMFRELTGDRSVEGYNSPVILYVVLACFATNIALTGCTAAVEYLWGSKMWGSKTKPVFEFTKLAAILSPWPLAVGILGFWFVLVSTGARFGS